jgi:dextranase
MVDLYPLKGTFSPGEPVRLIAVIEAQGAAGVDIRWSIIHLEEEINRFTLEVELYEGQNVIPLEFHVAADAPQGYGVACELALEAGVVSSAQTAFDVLESWTDYPRYGFLTDFAANRTDVDESVAMLARYHINGLQFYDWGYRHDCLLPSTESYTDPLGRALSLDTVRDFIRAAREHGIAAMPYLAVYAASMEFWNQHPEWRLFDEEGAPITFEDFLGLMDPSPEGPWEGHLLGECERALAELNFDGLHIDQYGEPKLGFNVDGAEVDIPAAFHDFITAAKGRFPDAVLTFNAVGNWPIDTLAQAPLDFNYIEIWDTTPTFHDLRRIAYESRVKSANKPFVIALYLPAVWDANIRLVDALIFASGGCRIELGEGKRLLTDPYFPKHQSIPSELNRVLRRYYDFAVRYGEWIGPWAMDGDEQVVNLPEDVWVVVRKSGDWQILNLINLHGLEETRWDEEVQEVVTLDEFSLEIQTSDGVRGVWWTSPDRADLALRSAMWHREGDRVVVNVPYLETWSVVAIEFEGSE